MSPTQCAFPLQNRSGREALLVHLLGIIFDHVARLPGDCRRLGIGASGFEEKYDCGLSQAMEHEVPITQGRHFWPA